MGVLKSITTGVKTIFGKSTLDMGQVFSTITNSMDDWKFTEQERATYNAKAAEAMADYAKATMNESTDRSKSRREIAQLVIMFYLITCLVGIVFVFISMDKTRLIMEFCNETYLTAAFITIIVFYFGGYYLDKFKSKQSTNSNG